MATPMYNSAQSGQQGDHSSMMMQVGGGQPPMMMGQIGQPVMTSQGGQPVMTNQGGQPVMMSQGGQPVMMSQGGQPVMTSQGGQPVMTSQGGQPVMMGHGGQPVMMSQGGQPVVMGHGGQPGMMSQGGQPVMMSQGGQPVVMGHGGQPGMIQQGYPGAPANNASVVYYVMSAPSQAKPAPPPKFDYIPNDYLRLSIATAVILGILSPLTLVFTLTAVYLSLKSISAAKNGDMESARKKGVISAYLNIFAIIFALLVGTVLSGAVIGVDGPEYLRQRCIENLSRQGRLPSNSTSYFRSRYVSCP